jgi:hypothetical protein
MNFDGEVKIWDYSSLPESNEKKGRARRETLASGGGMEEYGGGSGSGGGGEEVQGEEILKGKLQCLAVCRRGNNVPPSLGRLDVMSLAVYK